MPLVVRNAVAGQAAINNQQQTIRWNGVVMFADISGFTALTERLAAQGQVGAELLVTKLNSIFDRIVDTVVRYGGTVSYILYLI